MDLSKLPAIDQQVAHEFVRRVLEKVGVSPSHAVDCADVLVWTSLRGVDTHGLRNLKRYYVDWINDGQINADPEFCIEYETPSSARVDGDRGIGMAAACWAMRLAIEKATQTGIGMVTMRNSHHFGGAGFYAHMAVAHDMIGQCMTGFLFSEGNPSGVPPLFSLQPMLSTNPLAYAFPCREQPPFVLDMSTSVVPVNRLEMMAELGETIPAGWAIDERGNTVTDPRNAKIVLPLGGDRDRGGHKGYALGLVVEVLTSVLSGGWFDRADQPAGPKPERRATNYDGTPSDPQTLSGHTQEAVGHYFAATRIDLFRPADEFCRGMDGMIEKLHAAPPAPGCKQVYVPGELEHQTAQLRKKHGIPLPETVLADLQNLSQTYGVPLRLLL